MFPLTKKTDKIIASVHCLTQFSPLLETEVPKAVLYLRSRYPKFENIKGDQLRQPLKVTKSFFENIFHEVIQMEADNQNCMQFLISCLSLYTLDKPIYLLYKNSKPSFKVIYYCYLHQWHGCCEANVASTLENPGMKGTV